MVCFGSLVGDVSGDGLTNISDPATVRNHLNQPIDAGNLGSDVNLDGTIDVFDLITVRNNLNQSLTGNCP